MRVIVLTIMLSLLPAIDVTSLTETPVTEQAWLDILRKSDFSVENLHRYLELREAPSRFTIISQFALETGWFNSRLFKDGNNLAGMKVPSRRETTATGSVYGYASYNHWTDSVDDFLLWLEYHSLGENYVEYLKRGSYAEDPHYYQKIMNIRKRIKDENVRQVR